jgi:hypothetical protein
MKFIWKTAAKQYKWFTGAVLFISFTLLHYSFMMHPYYMSVTEIDYKAATKELQISVKLFTDDLEEALEQEYKQKFNLYNENGKAANESFINSYLQKHCKLTVNNKQLSPLMLGFEIQQEAVWVYFELKKIEKVTTAVVFSNVLYSLRKDQINIIHFTNKGIRKSYRLTNPDTQVKFSW